MPKATQDKLQQFADEINRQRLQIAAMTPTITAPSTPLPSGMP